MQKCENNQKRKNVKIVKTHKCKNGQNGQM